MLRAVVTALLIVAGIGVSQAADIHAGKALTDEHCYQCHGTEVYTRADRKVESLDALGRQVKRCELALGLKWFDEEIENVATYLNQDYYKFK